MSENEKKNENYFSASGSWHSDDDIYRFRDLQMMTISSMIIQFFTINKN